MLQAEARARILAEWSCHVADRSISNPTTVDAFSFYGDLDQHHRSLLQFRCEGDK